MNFNALKSHDGKVSEIEFNKLVDAVQSITLNEGVGYELFRTAAGTTLKTEGKGGGGAAPTCPFGVTVFTDGDTTKVKLLPGSVNQLIPTNMFDSLTISETGTYYIKAAVVSDGQKVTSSSLVADTSPAESPTPTPFALPAAADVLIAIVKDSKAYRVLGCGSINLEGREQFRTDKSPPAQPGELVYTPYYTWVLS